MSFTVRCGEFSMCVLAAVRCSVRGMEAQEGCGVDSECK